jgi:hypothetical protein
MPECFARRPLAKESSPFTLQAIMTPADSFEIILGLLAVVVVLELAARRLGLPPSAVMVLGGVGLALTPGVPELRLDPDLILVLFLPPLLFSGAYFTGGATSGPISGSSSSWRSERSASRPWLWAS